MKNIYYYPFLYICFLFSTLLLPSVNNEPFAEFKENKICKIGPITSDVNIDGYLNEETWNSSSKIEDFIQVSPKFFVDPSEVTSVHLTYDESFLYIGATLFSDSNLIVKKLGDYDSFEESFENNSDYFVIEIDSDHNHETAYGFAVNAANVKSDYMIYDDAMIDDYWDADWESAVIVDSLKWTVEIKIPFKCMRFNNKINELGVNFVRYIYSSNELNVWVAIPSKTDNIVSEYGHLIGVDFDKQSDFSLRPYFWTGKINYDDSIYDVGIDNNDNYILGDLVNSPSNIYEEKIGVDAKYVINFNTVLDLTLNPDFGQIEQDPSIVNNTAYEIEFDEKRPFFLEHSSFFETPIKLFYSRRIGSEINDSLKTNFNYAFNLLGGALENTNYGFLLANADTKKDDDVYYSVFRIEHKLLSDIKIGYMNTNYNFNSFSSKIISVDFLVNFFKDKNGYFDYQIAKTDIDNSANGYGINFEIGYSTVLDFNKQFEIWGTYEKYDKYFNINELGYLKRNDLMSTHFGFSYGRNNQIKNILSDEYIISYKILKNINGDILDEQISFYYTLMFKNFWSLNLGLLKSEDSYVDRFYNNSISIDENGGQIISKKPGNKQMMFSFNNDQRGRIYFNVGTNYLVSSLDDRGNSYMINTLFKINEKLSLDFYYDISENFETYHFLKYKKVPVLEVSNQFDNRLYFIESDNLEETYTIRLSSYINTILSVQLYYEYYKYINDWDTATNQVYQSTGQNNYNYPLAIPSSNQISDQDKIFYYSNYNASSLNFVIKASNFNNSNIYFVYSLNKHVNGIEFDNIGDFMSFGNDDIKNGMLAEIYYDQSFFIKYDFLFDL